MKRIIGQDYVCGLLKQAINKQNRTVGGSTIVDGTFSFCSNPQEYEWKYLAKKDMLVPDVCDAAPFYPEHGITQLKLANSGKIRWEMHRVWIVEGTLRRGESNVLARRRFYLEENSWRILLGEGFDRAGSMTKCFIFHKKKNSTACKQGQWYSTNNPEVGSA